MPSERKMEEKDLKPTHSTQSVLLSSIPLNSAIMADSEVDYCNLPGDLKRVIQGVRGVEVQISQIQCQYQKELYEVERKWHKKFQTAYDRRIALISGASPPTVNEINAGERRSGEQDEDYQKLPVHGGSTKAIAVNGFWVQVLKNNFDINMREPDERALASLTKIVVTYPQNSTSVEWVLEFHFAKNNFLKNSVLRLNYVYQDAVDSDGFLEYSHVIGDTIQWKPNQNLIAARSANDDSDEDDEECPSFFSLFSPPAAITKPAQPGDDDDERATDLAEAFDIGLAIKNKTLTRATDYFIGDADDFFDDDDDNGFGSDADDDDDESDND
ncbi:nucleosome assembly protein [Mycena galericulata]|nr:nucleosome assembly protein [Mycena galericulata]